MANLLPRKTREITGLFFAGDIAGAARIQCEMMPLIKALFCEVNPIPAKAAMAAMGFCENYVRLPLTTMEEANRQKLLSVMREQGIEV